MSKLAIRVVIITLAMELASLVGRFVVGLESTRDTTFIGEFTGGLRIHHGYLGIILVAISTFQLRHRVFEPFTIWHWVISVGLAMFLSDLIHHFLVLWPITGSPQFDLWYPVP